MGMQGIFNFEFISDFPHQTFALGKNTIFRQLGNPRDFRPIHGDMPSQDYSRDPKPRVIFWVLRGRSHFFGDFSLFACICLIDCLLNKSVPARLPLLARSGFLLDPRPLDEPASPHAGALVISRAFRSLKIPELVAANLQLKSRQRGFDEAQFIETVMLLQAVGGDCPEDLGLLNNDPMLGRALGYELPKVTAVRNFLERFHDEELALKRPARQEQKSFIMPASTGLQRLQRLQDVQAGLVRRV